MSTAATSASSDAKLSVRDLITIGILTAVFIAVFWTTGMILGMNPFTWPFLTAVMAVPSGIVFMLLLSRVPKRWTFFITGTVTAVVFQLTGHYWPMTVFMVVLSFLVDLFYSSGDPRSTKRMIIAYVLFSVSFTIAAYGPLALFAEAYMAAMGTEQYGLPANYYDFALLLYRGPLAFAMLGVSALGGLAGALLGRRVLQKSFAKAGLV
jgi:energy-coupling factor transport system substrate-specific component